MFIVEKHHRAARKKGATFLFLGPLIKCVLPKLVSTIVTLNLYEVFSLKHAGLLRTTGSFKVYIANPESQKSISDLRETHRARQQKDQK